MSRGSVGPTPLPLSSLTLFSLSSHSPLSKLTWSL
jgi:hypothetical protein